ncbi:MAG: class I SAM-dependent methyltransferase [Candidatus Eisenbacteria bacterium]
MNRTPAALAWPEAGSLPTIPTVHARAASMHAGLAASAPIERNGYALMEDLESPVVRSLIREMEHFQYRFMAKTRPVWTEGFKHTGDRLDNWSRRWEYPYCWWNLLDRDAGRVLDAGSGINFFPFFFASGGWDVTCADTNHALTPCFARANELLGTQVRFDVAPIEALPYADASFDAVYCVSVLEHAPGRVQAMDEFARVLRPGGRLVLTMDISLSRDCDVKLEDAAVILSELEQRFEPAHALDLSRPADLLTTDRFRAHESWRLSWRPHRDPLRRWLSWLRHGDPFRSLAVLGTTWTKR